MLELELELFFEHDNTDVKKDFTKEMIKLTYCSLNVEMS